MGSELTFLRYQLSSCFMFDFVSLCLCFDLVVAFILVSVHFVSVFSYMSPPSSPHVSFVFASPAEPLGGMWVLTVCVDEAELTEASNVYARISLSGDIPTSHVCVGALASH